MAYSTLPIAGVGLNLDVPLSFVYVAGTTDITIPNIGPLGTQTFGSDGKRYVLAQADATIAAETAVCDIDPVTFQVAATGGDYMSPDVELLAGQVAWFGIASV